MRHFRSIAPIVLALLLPHHAPAADFIVDTVNDLAGPGDFCSLREAFNNISAGTSIHANKCPKGEALNTITFAVAGPLLIDPLKGEIKHTGNFAEVTGPFVISGENLSRILRVGGAASLTLKMIALDAGSTPQNAGSGGAILVENNASLRLENSIVSHSYAAATGGGIAFYSNGILAIEQSHVYGNYARQVGGGIAIAGAAPTQSNIRHSTISENTSETGGGGIYCGVDQIVGIVNSRLRDNAVAGAKPSSRGRGGAIFSSCTLAILQAHIAHNDVRNGEGGALYNDVNGVAALAFVNLEHNMAGRKGKHPNSLGAGGAIYNQGDLQLLQSSVYRNTAVGGGGAVFVDDIATLSRIYIGNTTLAENRAVSPGMPGTSYLDGGALWITGKDLFPLSQDNDGLPDYRFRIVNNTFVDNRGQEQIYVDDGTLLEKDILLLNNIIDGKKTGTPGCGGNVARFTLRRDQAGQPTGSFVHGVQYPEDSCSRPGQSMEVFDMQLGSIQFGDYFDRAYALPGKEKPGDDDGCTRAPVHSRDQFARNRDICNIGALDEARVPKGEPPLLFP